MPETSYLPADRSEPLLRATIGDLLREAALAAPARVALIEGSADPVGRRRWTYAQLLAASETAARTLAERYRPGARIALYAGNSPEWMIAYLAIAMAGLVLVPINPSYTPGELGQIVRRSGAAALVHGARFRGVHLAPRARDVPGVEVLDLAALLALRPRRPDALLPAVSCEDLVQIQFTSGTTGTPKGACLHHHGIVNSSRFVGLRAGLPPGDVWINPMPLFHVGASVTAGIGSLIRQGTLVLLEDFDPALMLRLIAEERANSSLLVPTMVSALLDAARGGDHDLSSLRRIFSGATTVPVALVEAVRSEWHCGVSILFGQTEVSGNICETSPDDSPQDQSATIGRPLHHVETRIVDPATRVVVPVGTPGEICFRGYQIMAGYLDQPEETRRTIDAEGWIATGDLGTMDARGYLTIHGRLKDVIIRGGMNIAPREVEEVLFTHPAIAQASVIGVPDAKWGEAVAAVIQPRDGAEPPTPAELHALCREHLAPFKTPAQWYFVTALPLTPTGKVQKFILQDWIAARRIVATPFERATTREQPHV